MGIENACMSGLLVPYGAYKCGARAWARFDEPAPHVLVAGPSGSGKTSTVGLIAARCAEAGALVDWVDATMSEGPGIPGEGARLRRHVEPAAQARAIEDVYLYAVAASMQSDAAALPLRVLVIDEPFGVLIRLKVHDRMRERAGHVGVGHADVMYAQLSWLMSFGSRRTRTLLVLSTPVPNQPLFTRDRRARFGTRIMLGRAGALTSRAVFGNTSLKGGLRVRAGSPSGRGVATDGDQLRRVVVDRSSAEADAPRRHSAPSWFTDRVSPPWTGDELDVPRMDGDVWETAAVDAGLTFYDDVEKW